MNRTAAQDIDDYIAAFEPKVRAVLKKIRKTIRRAAPQAEEKISYRMPAFALNGNFVYFAAFAHHIGFYPPIRGDKELERAVAPYAGEKGNLRFPLDEPIPYELIERIVRFKVRQQMEKATVKRARRT